jgi:hypothetical protein
LLNSRSTWAQEAAPRNAPPAEQTTPAPDAAAMEAEGARSPASDPSGASMNAPTQGAPESNAPAESKAFQSEEEDFSGTPFTEYGEFNESQSEEADNRFFQNGRFFGVSLGVGMQTVDGARGALWQGGFPMVDFKVHYWFDFNFALDLGFFTAQHYFNTTALNAGHVDVNLLHVGVDLKYYFDTKNLSAPISFVNPYLILGGGAYTKTQNSNTQQTQDVDTSVGICAGAGLEFVISPRRAYFEIEGKTHIVTYRDTFTTVYQSVGLANMTGNFYTLSGSVLLTW